MNYHDPSAVLFKNQEIVSAVEEERINRIKGSKGLFPIGAINECCKIAGIKLEDLDLISVGYLPSNRLKRKELEKKRNPDSDYRKKIDNENYVFRNNLYSQSKIINELGVDIPISFHEHHKAHAASAFYPSGFDKALSIVIDGVGEFDSLSVWLCKKNNIKLLERKTLPYSLGYFYAAFTSFLGFKAWSGEGKTMGLAPYGVYDEKIHNMILGLFDDLVINSLGKSLDLDEERAISFIKQRLGISPNTKKEKINQQYKNIAYSVQKILEDKVVEIIISAINKYDISSICCAGGVFMNCKMNMLIREHPFVKNSYFQPVSKDSGLAIGAPLLDIKPDSFKLENIFLGSRFSNEQVKNYLNEQKIEFEEFEDEDLAKLIAKYIYEGKIICLFRGAAEMGSRALGNRSILANPTKQTTADFLNKKIKHRESWRPFACSIMEEKCSLVLESYKRKSPFMIEAFKVIDYWKERIPAVIHSADGTTRPQTVGSGVFYYKIINEFEKLSSIPLILNTSFNDAGEPIVNKSGEAIKFFFNSLTDVLVMQNCVIVK